MISDQHKDAVQVLHESGPVLHEGGPAQRMVLKAISNIGFSSFIAARD